MKYKLTDKSAFTTVMKAATKYGIELSNNVSRETITIFYKLDKNQKGYNEPRFASFDKCPEVIQGIIDEIDEYRRIEEEGGDYSEKGGAE